MRAWLESEWGEYAFEHPDCPEVECGGGMSLVRVESFAYYAHAQALREIRTRKTFQCESGHELVDDA